MELQTVYDECYLYCVISTSTSLLGGRFVMITHFSTLVPRSLLPSLLREKKIITLTKLHQSSYFNKSMHDNGNVNTTEPPHVSPPTNASSSLLVSLAADDDSLSPFSFFSKQESGNTL